MINPSTIHKKEPLIRIEKRTELYGFKQAMVILIAILVALTAGGVFILCLGHNTAIYCLQNHRIWSIFQCNLY